MEEFSIYRGLTPIRISVIGAPESGKTKLAKDLKKLLRINRLNIRNLVDKVKQ